MNPIWVDVLKIASGVTTILSLCALFGSLFIWFSSQRRERSLREIVDGEHVVRPEEVVNILRTFTSDNERLLALREILGKDDKKSQSIIQKVKGFVDAGSLSLAQKNEEVRFMARVGIYLLLLALAAVAATYVASSRDANVLPKDDKKDQVPVSPATTSPTPSAKPTPTAPLPVDYTRIFTGGAYVKSDIDTKNRVLRAAQERLKINGYYPYQVDGIPGPDTEDSIRKWQRTVRIDESGRLDQATLISLGLGDEPVIPMINEVLITVKRKTWVTVRKGDPKAAPIFEDYILPEANPLKLKGAFFYVDARDPTTLIITKNGLPFDYVGPSTPVQ